MNAFNLLQDMRHLIILDFRDILDFNEFHIRKSVISTLDSYKQEIINCISTKKPTHSSQYPNDDLKRVLLIFPASNWKTFES